MKVDEEIVHTFRAYSTWSKSFAGHGCSSKHTLYNDILRIARNLLETRENIKIDIHPFYHIICDWFSWGSSNWQELVILKNQQFWIFFCMKKILFCLISMKISHKLCGRMDGTQFWCFPWFPANSLLCVIYRYTV